MFDLFFSQNNEIILKLILAAFLGLILGIEREYAGKEAGLRTYSLVALGSCLFSLIPLASIDKFDFILNSGFDIFRMASQVVIGIGFLGAGLIIFRENKIRGLTTAAELWVVAAIGIAVAMGLYKEAIVSTIIVLILVYSTRKFKIEEKFHGAE